MRNIEIPLDEYEKLIRKLELLSDNAFLNKINTLIDLMYESKYGFFMKDFTGDLTESSITEGWDSESSPWDNV